MVMGLIPSRALSVAAFFVPLAATLGCSSSAPPRVAGADVDPDAAASRALQLWDGNSDGTIDQQEAAAKCRPLVAAMAAFDADSDKKLSSAEIAARLKAIANSGAALTGLECTVLLAGRPLPAATVKLRPVEMYDGALMTAEGVTNDEGKVQPSIGAANLPAKLAAAPLLYPGLYHVEITHPDKSIAARYNAETELGLLIDPTSRDTPASRFDLKAN